MNKSVLPRPLERDVQVTIITCLELAGFRVQHTSAFRQKASSGCAKGVPDLLCYHTARPGTILPIEVKRPGGRPSPEQSECLARGDYRIASSADEALELAAEWLDQSDDRFKCGAAAARVRQMLKAMTEGRQR